MLPAQRLEAEHVSDFLLPTLNHLVLSLPPITNTQQSLMFFRVVINDECGSEKTTDHKEFEN